MLKKTVSIVSSILLINIHRCNSLAHPRSRRQFVVDSVASITASGIIGSPLISHADETAQASSAFALPPIGVGAWAWGDAVFWGYDKKNDDELKDVFEYALNKNLAFFDTAELYGLGRSEELLGKFRDEFCKSKEEEKKVIIASKFAALPWRTKSEDVVKACKASVKRLG